MNPVKSILFILLIILLQSSVFHNSEDDCMGTLKEAFKNLNFSKAPKDNKIYFFDYSLKTTYKDKNASASVVRVKALLSREHIEIVSDQMEVYQDKTDLFKVIPLRKVIYLSDSDLTIKDSLKEKQMENTGIMKEEIFNHCTLNYCKEISGEKNFNREISINPSNDIKKSSMINNVTFFMDTKNKKIYKTIVNFTKETPHQSVELIYYSTSFDYKHNFNYSSKSKIFKSDGSLLSKFSGYKLVDIRNNYK